MEIEYFGAGAIRFKEAGVAIGFDLKLPGSDKLVGASKELRAVFFTDKTREVEFLPEGVMKFPMAGEYEVGPFSVRGVAVRPRGDVYSTTTSNVFLVDCPGFGAVGILAYVGVDIGEEAMELLASARMLIIPVGGLGLSLEPEESLKLAKELNAEFVVPVNFDDGKTKYESAQLSVEEFIKLTGMEADTFESKLNTKSLSAAAEGFKVVVIKP